MHKRGAVQTAAHAYPVLFGKSVRGNFGLDIFKLKRHYSVGVGLGKQLQTLDFAQIFAK